MKQDATPYPSWMDRRTSSRMRGLLLARMESDSGHSEKVIVENMARGGVCFRSPRRFRRKESVIFYLGRREEKLRARVIWSRPEGRFASGALDPRNPAFVTGCKVTPAGEESREQDIAPEEPGVEPNPWTTVMRYGILAGSMIGAAISGYILLSIVLT